jgi:hypothetical protein
MGSIQPLRQLVAFLLLDRTGLQALGAQRNKSVETTRGKEPWEGSFAWRC